MTHDHLLDIERQEAAWNVLTQLTGTGQHQTPQATAAE
jgi:hypothetical protein